MARGKGINEVGNILCEVAADMMTFDFYEADVAAFDIANKVRPICHFFDFLSTHIHTYAFSHSSSYSNSLTHSLSLSLSRTHTHTHTYTPLTTHTTYTHTHTQSLSLSND